jgi:hypothetical protein
MYPNPMQQKEREQLPPIQHPPTMMTAGRGRQLNTAVDVLIMRSMVLTSPMQASMIQKQQSPQSSMIV